MKMKRKRTIRKKKKGRPRSVRKKEAKRNFLRGGTTADFSTEKKKDDTIVDEDK
jgi:hypothetical protein